MHILFLTHYFPPEVNAPASRTFDNTRRWVRAGHEVTVITCAPSHPNGIVYPGYKNRLWCWDEKDGVKILRVKTFLSKNRGFFKRIANYVSYMISAVAFCGLVKQVDIVISTSPQFFCGMAGFWVSRLKRCPWILEIRDLWPESIVAVGALTQPWIIRALESIETAMYRTAGHVVCVTRSFKEHIVSRGIAAGKISVITNGADLETFKPLSRDNPVTEKYHLEGKFVVSYLGTHGMAHALRTVLRTADLLKAQERILFLLVGDGAERENLLRYKQKLKLRNVLMLPQHPKEDMVGFLSSSDVCLIHLRKADLFKTVIPSKIFEAMAMAKPIILGVEGECREIVESGQCGIPIEPENHRELAEAVMRLFANEAFGKKLGDNGRRFVVECYDRDKLSQAYLEVICRAAGVKMKNKVQKGASQMSTKIFSGSMKN